MMRAGWRFGVAEKVELLQGEGVLLGDGGGDDRLCRCFSHAIQSSQQCYADICLHKCRSTNSLAD